MGSSTPRSRRGRSNAPRSDAGITAAGCLWRQGRFEAGRILLPQEASWLADFENELLAFPSGRYDDQVDALLLFLEWFAQNEQHRQRMVFCEPIIVRQRNSAGNGVLSVQSAPSTWHLQIDGKRDGLGDARRYA
jgi:hypothetical protein